MYLPNDLIDVLRVITFLVSVYSATTLLIRYKQNHHAWNTKTKDYWYALFMWSLAGAEFCIQGIALDRPLTPATVFMIAAVLVTGKGVHNKSGWGNGAT